MLRPPPVLLVLFLLVAAASCAPSVSPPSDADRFATPSPEADRYHATLDRLTAGETDVDYEAFRMAFTATAAYAPYGTEQVERRTRMLTALFEAEDLDRAGTIADSALDANYTDIDAHFVAMVTSDEAGDSTRAAHHEAVFNGLIDSIVTRADGRSPESPWVVISTREEYALLRAFGLRVEQQSLVACGGRRCDLLEAVDPATDERHRFYFDVTIPFEHLSSRFSR